MMMMMMMTMMMTTMMMMMMMIMMMMIMKQTGEVLDIPVNGTTQQQTHNENVKINGFVDGLLISVHSYVSANRACLIFAPRVALETNTHFYTNIIISVSSSCAFVL